jgi:hypothetical protein
LRPAANHRLQLAGLRGARLPVQARLAPRPL